MYRLTAIYDQFGNSITFDYVSILSNRINNITDDLGRTIHFTYNDAGNIETIKDFADRQWEYVYDESGNLTEVLGPASESNPDGLIEAYSYDENHNLIFVADANGDEIMRNYYNDNDQVYRQDIDGASYVFDNNAASKIMTTTDREGNIIKQAYNKYGQLASYTVYTQNPADEPNHFATTYSYNAQGRRTRITYPAGNCVDFKYDSYGNLSGKYLKTNPSVPNVRTDEPNILVTTYSYDSVWKNKVAKKVSPINKATSYDYDIATGNLKKITYPYVVTVDGGKDPTKEFTYDTFGRIETVKEADGIVTKYVYYTYAGDVNNYGRLWKVIQDYNAVDGLNLTTELKYDRIGHICEIKDPGGNVSKIAFNDLDQMEKMTTPSPFNNVVSLSYDKNGNRAKIEREITGEPNQIIRLVYDRYEKLLRAIDPLNNITQYGYNKNKDPNIITDAENNSTRYGYNERGLVKTITDANGFVTKYRYNLNGYLSEIEDANGNITKYGYDGFDRLICITYPDDTNEVFAYDRNSNVTSKRTRNLETIEYEYNSLGWLTKKKLPGEADIVYSYDVAGRLRTAEQAGSITSYAYDRAGRIIEVNEPDHRIVKYEYDSRGLRTKLTYPDDSNVTYEYDSMSRLTKVNYNNNTIAEYGYDELSRRTLLKYANDTNAVYSYDLGDRLTRITNNINASPIDIQYSQYDNVGNRKNMIVDNNEHSYTYDRLYQLTRVDYPTDWYILDVNYYYDKLGSRRKIQIDTYTAEYNRNNLNQYTSVEGISYSYDLNGNLTNDGTYKYYYDCENQLAEVKQGQTTIATYNYDFAGRRISKTVSGVTTKYVYDGFQIIAEYENGSLVRKYIYGTGIDELICMIDVAGPNAIYYYHFDGLGSVIALSNNNGGLLEKYTYDVFGAAVIRNATGQIIYMSIADNRFMFTGREYDDETGNYYYRARYYKPSIGRFLQPDPIRYKDGLNLYTYCRNNPINFVDPYGQLGFPFLGPPWWLPGVPPTPIAPDPPMWPPLPPPPPQPPEFPFLPPEWGRPPLPPPRPPLPPDPTDPAIPPPYYPPPPVDPPTIGAPGCP